MRLGEGNRRITQREIAGKAGVSAKTVSLALRDDPRVAPNTKRAIVALREQLLYTKHETQPVSRQIGVIVPELSGAESVMTATLAAHFRTTNYGVIVQAAGETSKEYAQAIKLFQDLNMAGIIIFKPNEPISELGVTQKNKQPIIVINGPVTSEPIPEAVHLSIDYAKATGEGLAYLMDLGHEQIAYIGGLFSNSEWKKWKSFEQFAKEKQIREAHAWHIDKTDNQFEAGLQAINKILASNRLPTAIFAANEMIAIGAIRAIADKGLRVPEDLSVIGFGESELAEFYTPSLTVIDTDPFRTAMVSAAILHEALQGKALSTSDVVLPHRIVKRESTGPAPR